MLILHYAVGWGFKKSTYTCGIDTNLDIVIVKGWIQDFKLGGRT